MLRTISDHILDIVQNSFEADAKNVELVLEERTGEYFRFVVKDDGIGMGEEELEKIFDPFFTSSEKHLRKVGLGLPFLKQSAEMSGGYVRVESKEGKGTKVDAMFRLDSIDCPPLGDLPFTIVSLLMNTDVNLTVKRIKDGEVVYELSTEGLKEKYGDMIENPSFMKILLDSLKEMES